MESSPRRRTAHPVYEHEQRARARIFKACRARARARAHKQGGRSGQPARRKSKRPEGLNPFTAEPFPVRSLLLITLESRCETKETEMSNQSKNSKRCLNGIAAVSLAAALAAFGCTSDQDRTMRT